MTSGTATRRLAERRAALEEVRDAQQSALRRRRQIGGALWAAGILALVVVVAAGLISARPVVSDESRTAPGFTLPSSEGGSVSLSDFRGKPVVLYFNEGAGCDSCIVQMAEIEKEPGFAEAGIVVLPIVMNPPDRINAERERFGVRSPFLIDDGTVSAEYGTLGAGMHAGLPGHGFVLVDADGVQQWYGNYPSMWLAPEDLLDEVLSRL